MTREGEAETEPTLPALRGSLLPEALEYVGEGLGRMPIPVSDTVNVAASSCLTSRTLTRPPRGVNFTALLSKFQNTC